MPQYFTPGVYVEEIERGPRPIEGVATSTAAFLGETERGPTLPRLVTGFNEYTRWFGGVFDPAKFMPYAAFGFFDNGGRQLYVCRITHRADGEASATHNFGGLHVAATGSGEWGNRVWVKVEDSTTTKPNPADPAHPLPVGIKVTAANWSVAPAAGLFDPNDPANATKLPRPQLVESFDDVSLDPASPDFFDKRVNGNSALVVLSRADGNPSSTLPPLAPANGASALSGGATSATAISAADYSGDDPDPSKRIGLAALLLDDYRDVALLYSPAAPDPIVKELISQCENQKFRFTVVDSPSGAGNLAALDPRTTLADTEYGAFYFPWIYVSDPQSGAKHKVPPGAHVLGVYARTDTDRGVYKAPANEPLQDVIDLEFKVDDNAQMTLNPRGVNAIRNLPGRGIRVWGARTLSSNGLWKYVPVRRLFIFLERSIYEGTQWVVFEPNDERLWARVKDSIRLFLRTQWREGALAGTTEDQAFRIACDRTTMTQDDILNGRLICEIGIAPVRPAEFVVFRIYQNTAEAQT
jgi:phage tail sheath protein FI